MLTKKILFVTKMFECREGWGAGAEVTQEPKGRQKKTKDVGETSFVFELIPMDG